MPRWESIPGSDLPPRRRGDLIDLPAESTSSSRNSGFEVLALRINWMILPGIEPI